MSWSLAATGPAKDVGPVIAKQIEGIKLADTGEMETVKLVGALLTQALGTFEPTKPVMVAAQGSMGYKDWQSKTEPFQAFDVKVTPIHFSV